MTDGDVGVTRVCRNALLCALTAIGIAFAREELAAQAPNAGGNRATRACGETSLLHLLPNPISKTASAAVGGPLCPSEVDVPARVRLVRLPTYPAMLQDAGVEGEVVALLVIDATGRVDTSSLKIVRTTHDQFTRAVRAATATWAGRAALLGGRKFAQWIAIAVVFQKECPGTNPVAVTSGAFICVTPSRRR